MSDPGRFELRREAICAACAPLTRHAAIPGRPAACGADERPARCPAARPQSAQRSTALVPAGIALATAWIELDGFRFGRAGLSGAALLVGCAVALDTLRNLRAQRAMPAVGVENRLDDSTTGADSLSEGEGVEIATTDTELEARLSIAVFAREPDVPEARRLLERESLGIDVSH